MFADYHVHTEFSDDSVYPMEDVVKDAIRMGMDEICFYRSCGLRRERGLGQRSRDRIPGTENPSPMWTIPDMQSRSVRCSACTETGSPSEWEWNLACRRIRSRSFRRCMTDIRLILSFCRFIRWKTKSSGHRISERTYAAGV